MTKELASFIRLSKRHRKNCVSLRGNDLDSLQANLSSLKFSFVTYKKEVRFKKLVSTEVRVQLQRYKDQIVWKKNEIKIQEARGFGQSKFTKKRVGVEYLRLIKDPRILKIEISRNKFTIYTSNLKYHNKDKRIKYIGKFKIVLFMKSRTATCVNIITIRNLTYSLNGYGHPYINGGGTPCLDQYWKEWKDYWLDGEIYLSIDLLIHFLSMENQRGSGFQSIAGWFKYRKNIKEKVKPRVTARRRRRNSSIAMLVPEASINYIYTDGINIMGTTGTV